jgi:hypothetical protein
MNSRNKGKRGELEAAHLLQKYGYDARRGQQFAGINGDADVVGLPGIHLEVKRVEKLNIENAVEQFLEVQEQNGIPMLWAIVDTDIDDVEPIEIIAVGTGWEVPSTVDKYLGTAQDEFGFVWHYFTIKLQELEYQIDYEKTFAALAEELGKVGVSAE